MAMVNGVELDSQENLLDIPGAEKMPVAPEVAIGAIALNFAMKYADITTVQDGALYQQYKLEGRNMESLHLDMVFYYAEQIEKHLLQTPSRLARTVIDAIAEDMETVMADVMDGKDDAEDPSQ